MATKGGTKTSNQDKLNRCMPAAADAKLGDVLNDLVTAHNALLAKLDADTGVNATNYVATLSVKSIEER